MKRWEKKRTTLVGEIDRQLAEKKRRSVQLANRIVLDLTVRENPAVLDSVALEIRYLAFQMRKLRLARFAALTA